MSTLNFTLIARETCHLCHDMWAELQILRQKESLVFEVVWCDLEDNAALEHTYGTRIPVLLNATEEVICEGRLDANKIRRVVHKLAK